MAENRDKDDLEKTAPGHGSEGGTPASGQKRTDPDSPSEGRQGQGGRRVQEYPGEGVGQHYPSDPSTGERNPSPRTSPDGEADDEGAE